MNCHGDADMSLEKLTSHKDLEVRIHGNLELHLRNRREWTTEVVNVREGSFALVNFPNATLSEQITKSLRNLNGFRKNQWIFDAAYRVIA